MLFNRLSRIEPSGTWPRENRASVPVLTKEGGEEQNIKRQCEKRETKKLKKIDQIKNTIKQMARREKNREGRLRTIRL